MDRKEFLKICAGGCLGLVAMQTTLPGCASHKKVNGVLMAERLEIPVASFERIKRGQKTYLNSVVVRNPNLQYPIAVFRFDETQYQALLMKCTHQGTELKLYGDTLQCIAHGSEFDKAGDVTTGPATQKLRSFPALVENEKIKISLK